MIKMILVVSSCTLKDRKTAKQTIILHKMPLKIREIASGFAFAKAIFWKNSITGPLSTRPEFTKRKLKRIAPSKFPI